ncbi:MAG: 16S rRNA (cytosine(1402)-N(4))-methyltransferase RsmH [Candidatus Marinimicrobia bacterium]|nr:16S rRNA (cytosine(1402)-N(4))-methyltransferase RsmH [Candidatus Neomarinimicrobiota bacterium]
MSTSYHHTPVLLREAVEQLVTSPTGIYIDATCGLGGHAEKILEQLKPKGHLYCFDLDPEALTFAEKRLARFKNVAFIQNNFDKLKVELFHAKVTYMDGILYDLGVSSMEIDTPERGFSFMQDGPLDMRMGETDMSAEDVINTYSRQALTDIFRNYGEERFSGRIANQIVETRPYHSTTTLRDCIRSVVHGPYINKTLARIFQSLRIEVNDELNALKKSLKFAIDMLRPGGRIVVISYHSLEDRIVKQTFQEAVTDCICPPRDPICTCGHKAVAKKITKKPIIPSVDEINKNPRSRSAKCRVIEKL